VKWVRGVGEFVAGVVNERGCCSGNWIVLVMRVTVVVVVVVVVVMVMVMMEKQTRIKGSQRLKYV